MIVALASGILYASLIVFVEVQPEDWVKETHFSGTTQTRQGDWMRQAATQKAHPG